MEETPSIKEKLALMRVERARLAHESAVARSMLFGARLRLAAADATVERAKEAVASLPARRRDRKAARRALKAARQAATAARRERDQCAMAVAAALEEKRKERNENWRTGR